MSKFNNTATENDMATALSVVEMAVLEMAERGIDAQRRAIALAFHMQKQVDLAMPNKTAAGLFKLSLATT